MRVNAGLFGLAPPALTRGLMALTPFRRMRKMTMKELGLPDDVFMFVNYPTRFDCRETQKLLKPAGIAVPPLRGLRLAAVGLLGAPSRSGAVRRPVAARRGRGQARAHHRRLGRHRQGDRAAVAKAGAKTLIVARDVEKLELAREEFSASASRSRPTAPTSPMSRNARR